MEFEQRRSGLAVPRQKPEPIPQTYAPLELTDANERQRAEAALRELWQVTGLEYPRGVLSADSKRLLAARLGAWQHLAHMLLGDDFECEVLT